jgi:pyruvate dehydrogenase phosphatase
MKQIEERLREHATFESKPRPGGVTWKYSTAFLPSNDPIEDAHAHEIVQRDESDPSAPGDFLFLSVMDGHSGTHTSQLLSKVLIKAVALELSSLISNPSTAGPSSVFDTVKSTISPARLHLGANPERVSIAIQNAFSKLDSELINAPLRVLAANLDEESRKNKVVPDLSQHPMALATMLPALSGG